MLREDRSDCPALWPASHAANSRWRSRDRCGVEAGKRGVNRDHGVRASGPRAEAAVRRRRAASVAERLCGAGDFAIPAAAGAQPGAWQPIGARGPFALASRLTIRASEISPLVVAATLLAAITHLTVVLLTPVVATRDAYARLAAFGKIYETVALPQTGPGERLLPLADPAVAAAFCRYNPAAGPIPVRGPTGRAFSSIAFHTRRGLAFYALTEKAGAKGAIEAFLATPADLRALAARDDEESPSRDLRIAAPEREGYVMLRVFSALPSLYAEADAGAGRLTCKPEPVAR